MLPYSSVQRSRWWLLQGTLALSLTASWRLGRVQQVLCALLPTEMVVKWLWKRWTFASNNDGSCFSMRWESEDTGWWISFSVPQWMTELCQFGLEKEKTIWNKVDCYCVINSLSLFSPSPTTRPLSFLLFLTLCSFCGGVTDVDSGVTSTQLLP